MPDRMRISMKKVYAFLLAVCMLVSGCNTGNGNNEKETVGQVTEQTIETEMATENVPTETVEETETEAESMVTICTDIDSRIIEKDSSFEHMDRLNDYLDAREFTLIEQDCQIMYEKPRCLFKEDEAEGWTEEDWDLVRPLEQISTSSMGYLWREILPGFWKKEYWISVR